MAWRMYALYRVPSSYLCHWSRLCVTILKLHHTYSVRIFPTPDRTTDVYRLHGSQALGSRRRFPPSPPPISIHRDLCVYIDRIIDGCVEVNLLHRLMIFDISKHHARVCKCVDNIWHIYIDICMICMILYTSDHWWCVQIQLLKCEKC